MLEQPIAVALRDAKRVLLAGCGGGDDALGTVPLFAALEEHGVEA